MNFVRAEDFPPVHYEQAMSMSQLDLLLLKKRFSTADSIMISAGAGMGVDSGLPDFRGNQGMWQAYPALGQRRMDFSQIANPKAFRLQPALAWGFYGHRLALYRQTQPHDGFYQLKQLIEHFQLPYFIFTSNVDGQFQKAGFADDAIYECHGSIHHVQCSVPCCANIDHATHLNPNIDAEQCLWQGELPRCPQCNALQRPNILMFNDQQWLAHRSDAQGERLSKWIKKYHHTWVIELGAGTAIPTVRYFSEQFAPRLIRINPRESQVPKGCFALPMGAKQGVETLLNLLLD